MWWEVSTHATVQCKGQRRSCRGLFVSYQVRPSDWTQVIRTAGAFTCWTALQVKYLSDWKVIKIVKYLEDQNLREKQKEILESKPNIWHHFLEGEAFTGKTYKAEGMSWTEQFGELDKNERIRLLHREALLSAPGSHKEIVSTLLWSKGKQ